MSAIVLFRVKCPTSFPQKVVLVGNLPILGNWDPSLGLELNTSPQMYPIWTCDKQVVVELNALIEFKLVIVDGPYCYWENLGNRCIRAKGHKQLVVLTYNVANLQTEYLQRVISETDLEELHLVRRRRINLMDLYQETDSETDNNEQESDLQSLFKEDSVPDQEQGSPKAKNFQIVYDYGFSMAQTQTMQS